MFNVLNMRDNRYSKNNPQHLYDEGGFVIYRLNLMTLIILPVSSSEYWTPDMRKFTPRGKEKARIIENDKRLHDLLFRSILYKVL